LAGKIYSFWIYLAINYNQKVNTNIHNLYTSFIRLTLKEFKEDVQIIIPFIGGGLIACHRITPMKRDEYGNDLLSTDNPLSRDYKAVISLPHLYPIDKSHWGFVSARSFHNSTNLSEFDAREQLNSIDIARCMA